MTDRLLYNTNTCRPSETRAMDAMHYVDHVTTRTAGCHLDGCRNLDVVDFMSASEDSELSRL